MQPSVVVQSANTSSTRFGFIFCFFFFDPLCTQPELECWKLDNLLLPPIVVAVYILPITVNAFVRKRNAYNLVNRKGKKIASARLCIFLIGYHINKGSIKQIIRPNKAALECDVLPFLFLQWKNNLITRRRCEREATFCKYWAYWRCTNTFLQIFAI